MTTVPCRTGAACLLTVAVLLAGCASLGTPALLFMA